MKPKPLPTAVPTGALNESFLRDFLEGLTRQPKILPSKYFYDERGSRLFEEICQLPEYYLTRTELSILQENIEQIAALAGPEAILLELGSGSSRKTCLLLDHFVRPAAYVPVEIAARQLQEASRRIASAYPQLEVVPVCSDYTEDFQFPSLRNRGRKKVAFFPGSTIGNFAPAEASSFLRKIHDLCRPDGGLLIGVDLLKPRSLIERAYNDSQGITAAFNLNILRRAQVELGALVDLANFKHLAFFNEAENRIEMRLASLKEQLIQVGWKTFQFGEGEEVITEYSHKYSIEGFQELAQRSGFKPQAIWTDRRRLFSVHWLAC
jgi:dimethylhistidine N-methyltransferase